MVSVKKGEDPGWQIPSRGAQAPWVQRMHPPCVTTPVALILPGTMVRCDMAHHHVSGEREKGCTPGQQGQDAVYAFHTPLLLHLRHSSDDLSVRPREEGPPPRARPPAHLCPCGSTPVRVCRELVSLHDSGETNRHSAVPVCLPTCQHL